jgi:uncharacterized membrane protein
MALLQRRGLPIGPRGIWTAWAVAWASVVAGQAVSLLATGRWLGLEFVLTGAWVVWALTYLALIWRVLPHSDSPALRGWAHADERGHQWYRVVFGRMESLSVPLVGAVYGFAAAVWVLPRADGLTPFLRALLLTLSVAAVLLAWAVIHTGYALHYAYLYFHGEERALDFPGTTDPRGLDFAYFACGVATTLGTTDVRVVTTRLRQAVIGHAVLSFAFNSGILAITLSLLLG